MGLPPLRAFGTQKHTTPPSHMNSRTGQAIHRGSTALWANDLAKKLMQWKNLVGELGAALRADLIWFPNRARTMPLLRTGSKFLNAQSSPFRRKRSVPLII